MDQYTDVPLNRCTNTHPQLPPWNTSIPFVFRIFTPLQTFLLDNSLAQMKFLPLLKSPVFTGILELHLSLTAFEALQLASFFQALVQELVFWKSKIHLPQPFDPTHQGEPWSKLIAKARIITYYQLKDQGDCQKIFTVCQKLIRTECTALLTKKKPIN